MTPTRHAATLPAMYWQIDGSDRNSGADRTVFVEANSEIEALRSEAAKTLQVTRCCPLSGKPGEHKSESDDSSSKTPASEKKRRNSSRIKPQESGVPPYSTIATGSKLMHTLGSISLIGGLVAFGWAAVKLFGALALVGKPEYGAAMHATTITFISGVVAIFLSAVLQWVAGVGLAIRDIAQNSFRQNRIFKKAADRAADLTPDDRN